MVTTTRRGNRQLLSYSTEELVARWEEFLDEANLTGRITKLADAYPEERSLEVDYGAIDRFDSDLAIYLLDHRQNAVYSVEQAIRSFVPPTEEAEIRFRVRGVPRDLRVEVRDLRAKHLGKLVSVEGLVRKATEVRPRLVEAVFQCLRCGAVIKEAQEGLDFREPLECYEDQGGCSRTTGATKFKLLDEGSRYIDTQKIEIQEAPEDLRGGEAPQRLAGYLEEDLVGLANPGDRIVFNGVLRGSQRGRFRSKSTLFDIFLDVVGLELEEVEYEEIEITPEDEERILEEAASGDVIRKIVGSIAPSIYGLHVEKEALALQLFGGVAKELPDGRRIRGDSHVLLIGDPGTAKSELLTYIVKLSPRGIYTSGKAATPAGLVAAAVRDEFGEGRWTLEAGALVLADRGLVAIDEIEKMNEQDRSSIHNAMEQQTVHIAKAGITATLQTRTSILAAANPTFGRFDSGKYISEQIDLPPTLLSVDGDEPVMVRRNGVVRTQTIGTLVDPYYSEGEGGIPVRPEEGSLEVAAFDPHTFRMSWSPVRYVFRHRHSASLLRVTLDSGRTIRLTRGHSVYVFEDGVVQTKATSQLQPDDYVVIPGSLPANSTAAPRPINLIRELLNLPEEATRTVYLHDVPAEVFAQLKSEIPKERKYWVHRGILPLRYAAGVDDADLSKCTLVNAGGGRALPGVIPVNEKLMRFLGYYIAEGSLTISTSKSFMISLSFNRSEDEYVEDVKSICQDLFGIEPRTRPDNGAVKVAISDKILYLFLERVLRLPRGAWNKRVPDIVFNVPQVMQREFLVGWLRGDRGGTVSRRLASDILYLLSQNRLVGSLFRIKEHTATFPDGHQATSSGYLLVSPNPYQEDRLRNRGRHQMVPYRPVVPLLKEILGAPFAGWYGKTASDPRLGPSMQRNLLQRPTVRKRLKRLRLLRSPITTSEASVLFEETAHREHARVYLQRMVSRGWVERETINAKGKSYSWRYRYRLSAKGERLLADVDRLNRLIEGDLAFARVKSVESVEASGPYVYDLSTPGRENFVAGNGGIVCHNSRFDTIFPILDKPQAQVDRAMAEHILRGHLAGEKIRQAESHRRDVRPEEVDEAFLPYFEPAFLRKYIAYAKRVYPVLTPEAMQVIQDKYLEIRKQGEGETGTVPITPRQLEAFIRLAEASARARLSRNVEEEDAERSVHIAEYWLERVTGIEGGFDIDIVATGLSQSQRGQIIALREIIGELAERDGAAVLKDILEAAEERGVPPNRVEAWLKRWSQEGEVYSPAPNKWRLV
ncbi:MAG: ATP-binding protein, partial [Thermoplasmata archaeon]